MKVAIYNGKVMSDPVLNDKFGITNFTFLLHGTSEYDREHPIFIKVNVNKNLALAVSKNIRKLNVLTLTLEPTGKIEEYKKDGKDIKTVVYNLRNWEYSPTNIPEKKVENEDIASEEEVTQAVAAQEAKGQTRKFKNRAAVEAEDAVGEL